jgi:hypothetical protein
MISFVLIVLSLANVQGVTVCQNNGINISCVHGYCEIEKSNSSLTYCECWPSYGTTTEEKKNNTYCNYEKKRGTIAIILEIVMPAGGGYFYIERYDIAIPQLLFFAHQCILLCVLSFFMYIYIGARYIILIPYTWCTKKNDDKLLEECDEEDDKESESYLRKNNLDGDDKESQKNNLEDDRELQVPQQKNKECCDIYTVCWFVGILIWWIYSLVLFVNRDITDGNGVTIGP